MLRFSCIAAKVLEPNAWLASALLTAFVALLPMEPLYNAPLIALATLGFLRLVFRRTRLGSPENRFLVTAFLCVWLPMLASLPDAVNLPKSARTTAGMCIYFLAGVYVIGAYTRFRDLDRIMVGVAAIFVFWCLDALWQLFTGTDWFGIPYQGGARLSGPFTIDGRLGIVFACFAPFFFTSIHRTRWLWPWSPVLIAPFMTIIVLSGSRASWMALAIGIAGYLVFLARWPECSRRELRRVSGVSVATMLVVVSAAYAWPEAAVRAKETVVPRITPLAGLWSGDREEAERALSYRLSIWETGLNVFSAHWLNGVGPRGFRFVYDEYNEEHDYFTEAGIFGDMEYPVNTPHLQLLEIAADTGGLGLLGYVILLAIFSVKLYRLELRSFRLAYPYAITFIIVLFPLNGYLHFYRVFSAGLIWWTVILTASAFAIASRKDSANADGVIGD